MKTTWVGEFVYLISSELFGAPKGIDSLSSSVWDVPNYYCSLSISGDKAIHESGTILLPGLS